MLGMGGTCTQPGVGGWVGFGEAKKRIQVRTLRLRMATNKICFKVRVYNVPDNLYDRGKKM